MSSGENALVLRQYRYLQTRSLLYLQDELRELERELYVLDERDRLKHPNRLSSREVAGALDPSRTDLMRCIRVKWTEYGAGKPLILLFSLNLGSFSVR